MKTHKKKRPLTLIEIMIVIVLIGLIGSVIGVNMKGSLEQGKAFKSTQAIEQIKDILMLEIAQGATPEEVVKDPVKYLENSGLVKNPNKFINDGWGCRFVIKTSGGNISVTSEKLKAYNKKKDAKLGKSDQGTDENEEE